MSYEYLGIFCRSYLFYLFPKKDFESEGEGRKEGNTDLLIKWLPLFLYILYFLLGFVFY